MMSIEIELVSLILGFTIGWIFKIAASNIKLPNFGKQHDNNSALGAVTTHLQETRNKVNSTLDEMMDIVNNYKQANNESPLTKEEVNEVFLLFATYRSKLKDI